MILSFRIKKLLFSEMKASQGREYMSQESSMVNSILCLYVKFEELVGFKWTFSYMNFILWKMDWIKDIGLGITRI